MAEADSRARVIYIEGRRRAFFREARGWLKMDNYGDTEVLPGQILAGKFRIEQVLGRGGMGVVVAATHLQLEERVAIKFLLPDALRNAEAVRRFEREARAAVKIKSEHVARVTDVGTLETGSPYMVMEFLSGMDLGQYLERQGPLPVDEAVDYLLQASEAIAEAHSMGIVHRDLKPANLFRILRADGTPSIKVLDFGISKVAADNSMTMTSSMMGSPYYMSPEQMTSAKTVDARTDIWALGVILHELLTGRVPYGGDTVPEVCAQVLTNPPPDVSEVRSDVAPELAAVIARCLAKTREGRFEDVAAFANSLVPFGPENASFSAVRISRVLGVAPTVDAARASSYQIDGSGRGAHTNTVRAQTASSETRQDAVDPGAMTTLGGAANTQEVDLAPPTKKTPVGLLLAGAAGVLAVVGAIFAFSGSSPAEAESAAEGFEANEASPVAPETNADAPRAPEPPAAPPTEVVAPEVAAPQPAPSPAKTANPASDDAASAAGKVKPKPKPTGSTPTPAAASPTPAAPAPKPAPAKPSNDLLLDRK